MHIYAYTYKVICIFVYKVETVHFFLISILLKSLKALKLIKLLIVEHYKMFVNY